MEAVFGGGFNILGMFWEMFAVFGGSMA